jgi:high affinity Mn2+ porin
MAGIAAMAGMRRRVFALVAASLLTLPVSPSRALGSGAADTDAAPEERFAIHGQITYTEQDDDGFHAPYAGTNSLSPHLGRETVDGTLFLGARLWQGAELWMNPEIDQGFGLDNTLGMAGFPSAEAYKVGKNEPYLRLPRAFVRQVVDTSEEREAVPAAANQLAGSHGLDRWVFTIGKFGVTDIFDVNQFAHDARNDFLNWAAVDGGAFDYAADAWGFTVGAAAERYWGSWTLRAGIFDLSTIPNSVHLDPGLHEFQFVDEIEKRYPLFGQTGHLRLTVFDSRGRMGLLDQAIALAQATATIPSVADVRAYRSRLGGVVGLEQPITDAVGVFARVSKAAGNVEAYEFTEIDRSVEFGSSIAGSLWQRPNDTVGIAVIDNGISAEREAYLSLGGLGVLVGDGKLPHPGPEEILETYYSVAPWSWAHVTLDYQWAKNPAYNKDRGPVSIVAVRVHAQF